jgi:hypothetical protein
MLIIIKKVLEKFWRRSNFAANFRIMDWKYTLAFLCVAAAVCGCNKEETPSEPVRHTVTLRANAAGDENTRSIFNSQGQFYWLPTDAIGVETESGDGTKAFSELKWDTGKAYTTSGSFSGNVEGTVGTCAVYPYNAAHTISGTNLTYNLPSTYTYTGLDNDYYVAGSTSYINSANAPAYGVIKDDGNGNLSTQFQHLGGVLCIKLDWIPATAGHITITADKQITGDFKVNLEDSNPQITPSDNSSAKNTVTINWENATQGDSGGVFYFPMPVGTFNVSVEVGYHAIGSGDMARVSKSREVTITRRLMKKVSLAYDTMAKDSYYIYGGHKFIDLGLPSGLLWAETNVGADNIGNCGNYYVWGETQTKDNYGKITSYSKYNNDGDVLALTDDAAYVNWGKYCRMPSKAEWQELNSKCEKGTNASYYGRTYIGTNGNSIFLPAGGFRIDDSVNSSPYEGYYWCRDLAYAPDYPNVFVFNSDYNSDAAYTRIGFDDEDDAEDRCDFRYKGYSIRPVVSIKEIGY